jgi:4-alpha-glucanotransferase
MMAELWQENNRSRSLPALVRRALGNVEAQVGSSDEVRVIQEGQALAVEHPVELQLEDGTHMTIERRLPTDLPCGYHTLRHPDSGVSRLIVAPSRCFLPEGFHTWGWSTQLYSTRSRQSWGIGDLEDLTTLTNWTARQGAGVILVNPLKADWPVGPQQRSPYSPMTRLFGNLLYVQPEQIEGARAAGLEMHRLAAIGHMLNQDRLINRDAILKLKMEALSHLWDGGRWLDDSVLAEGFDAYRREQGELLRQFAGFCAMAEQWGPDWRQWPGDYRRPTNSAVTDFYCHHSARIEFYEWAQWQFDRQLARTSEKVRIIHDVPVGFTPNGFDAWLWQDVLAADMTVGAPPDAFSAEGQAWGLPPFVPDRLRASAYEPFIRTIRASFRHAGGIRLDHVMGLFRQWWIPSGESARQGGYVYYPAADLLAIVALESRRAGGIVIGEDLGTVEADVRTHLSRHRLLSYKVMWFEEDPPASYPRLSVACTTTHDLPTLAGVWTGGDARIQSERGISPDTAQLDHMKQCMQRISGRDDQADFESLVDGIYRSLASSPSAMVLVPMEDGVGSEERPNYPAAMTSELNWSVGLPLSLEDWCHAPLVEKIVSRFACRREGA